MMVIDMTISEKIAFLRKYNGLSQEQLAAKLNVSWQTVSAWEFQQTMPRTSELSQMCNIFGVTLEQLTRDDIKLIPAAGVPEVINAAPSPINMEVVYCACCGQKNSVESNFCGYCGNSLKSFAAPQISSSGLSKEYVDCAYYQADLRMQQESIRLQQEALNLERQKLEEAKRQTEEQQRMAELQQRQYDKMAKCPLCGSTALSGNKKGYGVGKGLVGAALFGPVGLVAGGIGANKVMATCLNCGYKFKAGRKF